MSIQLFQPHYRVEETLLEIKDCLEAGWTGLGYKTASIEDAWSDYTGHNHSHFLNSNTAGLHAAIWALKTKYGWDDGDEVLTTPLTFISTNHAILYNNLKPVFCDVDDSLNIDPNSVLERISDRTRAIFFVGLGGNAANLQAVKDICVDKGIRFILDAAHMAGSRVNSKHVGVSEGIDCAVYSFQAVKNMPTGDSGMICFNDPELDKMVRQFSWLGIDKDTYARSNANGSYKWQYSVNNVGYKYNGNAIMAAIALVSLKYLDEDNQYRRQIAAWYQEGFESVKGVDIIQHENVNETSQHLVQIIVSDRDKVLNSLYQYQIYPGVHYELSSQHPVYKGYNAFVPKAEQLSKVILSLPCHMNLKKPDVDKVISAIKEITGDNYEK